jgi:putative membrane protein
MDTAYASMDSAIAGQGGLCDSVTALSSGASQLNTGLNTIVGTDNANSKALRDGAAALSDGASQLDSSAATLASGVSQLASGASELKDGSAALAAGASQVSPQIKDGDSCHPG